jgi:predicted nucleic acid-binding protein
VVSTQVVQEFLNVATSKFTTPLTFSDAQQYLHDVLGALSTVFPSIDLFRNALALQQETRFSFYDSLIIGGALQAGCDALFSEDLQHNQQIRGLKILNPFLSSSCLFPVVMLSPFGCTQGRLGETSRLAYAHRLGLRSFASSG